MKPPLALGTACAAERNAHWVLLGSHAGPLTYCKYVTSLIRRAVFL